MAEKLTSPVYVVEDNIDTDQIIPAQYLALVPTIPEEYEKLGSYAMAGLPSDLYPIEFIKKDTTKTEYKIVIAGKNFGCGSSREHAPVSLGAAGVEVIVADSYARIFFRNSVATGELYPYEAYERLIDSVKTGDVATVDFDADTIEIGGAVHQLKPMGDVRPVIDAGGLFNYARKSGMFSKP
jgi:3-isopropylmalate/(R)-2-methylmalate dehydratase small subunit